MMYLLSGSVWQRRVAQWQRRVAQWQRRVCALENMQIIVNLLLASVINLP